MKILNLSIYLDNAIIKSNKEPLPIIMITKEILSGVFKTVMIHKTI